MNLEKEADANYHRKHRDEVAVLVPDNYSRVLEIGCGEGRFRANLLRNCEYVGVEPSPAASDVARSVLDTVLTGTYEQVLHKLPNTYFDLVICNDVIEHMSDHDHFLDSIKEKMVPGAHLMGSIPNVRHLPNLWSLVVGRDWQYQDHGTLDRTHLRFFTPMSWRRTLEAHGYQIDVLQGINPLHLGRNPLKVAAKLALVKLVGSDSRFLQFAWRAMRRP